MVPSGRSRRARTATSGSGDVANEIGEINPTTHAISVFTLPSGYEARTVGDHGRVRRQCLVHLEASERGGDDQPDDPCRHRVRPPFRLCGPHRVGTSRRDPTATSGSLIRRPVHRDDQPDHHAISDFATTHTYYASGITSGPDGNLWFTETNAGRSVRSTRRLMPSPSTPFPLARAPGSRRAPTATSGSPSGTDGSASPPWPRRNWW